MGGTNDEHGTDAGAESCPELPAGWIGIEGLVCGFGSRTTAAPPAARLLRRQVHGTTVVDAAVRENLLGREPGDGYTRIEADADALVAAEPGIVVGVRTADCVPLLLVAPAARWAVAVHAGWRGTIGGIAAEAVKAAERAGIRPEDLLAALGPAIGPCCYEVSAELGDEFERAGLPVLRRAGAKPHLDLRAANRLLLEQSGLKGSSIAEVGPCTRCARDRYHSFRADPGSAGRQVSWIGWEARTRAPDRARPR